MKSIVSLYIPKTPSRLRTEIRAETVKRSLITAISLQFGISVISEDVCSTSDIKCRVVIDV
jgi:hypothetical protein